jgi:hypothetical protein
MTWTFNKHLCQNLKSELQLETQFLDTQHFPQKVQQHRHVICLTYYSSHHILLLLLYSWVRFHTVSPRKMSWKVWRTKRTEPIWTTIWQHEDSIILGYDAKSMGNRTYRPFKMRIPRYLETPAPGYPLTQHHNRRERNNSYTSKKLWISIQEFFWSEQGKPLEVIKSRYQGQISGLSNLTFKTIQWIL